MEKINMVFAVLGAFIGTFLGGWDGFIYALVIFVTLDYITGVLAAFKRKEASSEIGFWGLVRKVLVLVMVGIANILDVYILGTGSAIRTAIIFYFLSNEGLSLLENAAELGVPISEKLRDALAQLRDKGGGGAE